MNAVWRDDVLYGREQIIGQVKYAVDKYDPCVGASDARNLAAYTLKLTLRHKFSRVPTDAIEAFVANVKARKRTRLTLIEEFAHTVQAYDDTPEPPLLWQWLQRCWWWIRR